MAPVADRRLLLVGAGHAHLEVLAGLARRPQPGLQLTVVSPDRRQYYSGCIPGVLGGWYRPEDAALPAAAIVERLGGTFVESRATALDPAARTLHLASGDTLTWDVLSLDVGSSATGDAVWHGAGTVFPLKPWPRVLTLLAHLDACFAAAGGGEVPLAVVGAGAAGVEVACALSARARAAGVRASVTLIDPAATDGHPLPGFRPRLRALASAELRAVQCRVVGDTVVAAQGTSLRLASGAVVEAHATVWVAGASAPAWLATSGLRCDPRGFPLADATLCLDVAARIFGGGDCISLSSAPHLPKAGVYAVRMGEHLARTLPAAVRGAAVARYHPQADFLALLSTRPDRALLRWRGVAVAGGWAQQLKRRIDDGYVARMRGLAQPA